MVVGVATGLVMRPVDLSSGGAVVKLVDLRRRRGARLPGVRERRERFEAEVVAARERAARSAADERARITRELHDIIGHAMSVMVVQAGVAEQLLDTDPDAGARGAGRDRARPAARRSPRCASCSARCATTTATDDGRPRDPLPDLARLPALVEQVAAAGLPVELAVAGEPARAARRASSWRRTGSSRRR